VKGNQWAKTGKDARMETESEGDRKGGKQKRERGENGRFCRASFQLLSLPMV